MGGILEAIKKGFGIATKSLGLVLILFIFNLIWNLASIPLAVTPGTQLTPRLTAIALVFSAVFILVSIFVQGGTLGLVRDRIKEGKMALAGFAKYGSKYYLRLLGLGIIIILIVAIVALIAGLIVVATTPLNNRIITVIAAAIAVIIGIAAALLYFIPLSMAPYALVSEELGVIAAMKRSLAVVKKPFSRIFALLLLFVFLILIALGIGVVLGFVVGLVSAVVPVQVGKILMAVVTSIINSYLGIVMMAAFMAFYLGLAKEKIT